MTLKDVYVLCHGGIDHDRRTFFAFLYVAMRLAVYGSWRRIGYRIAIGCTCPFGYRRAVFAVCESGTWSVNSMVTVEFAPMAVSTRKSRVVDFTPALALPTYATSRQFVRTIRACFWVLHFSGDWLHSERGKVVRTR
jgi:hypothetical protein